MAPPLITAVADFVAVEDSGGTTQAVPLALGGLTPWFVHVVLYRTTLDDDVDTGTGTYPQQSASVSVGCGDGTNEWTHSLSSEDGANPTDLYDWLRTGVLVTLLNPANGFVEAEAVFSSWSANLLVLDWTVSPVSPGSGWKGYVFACAGGGGSAQVGVETSNSATGGTAEIAHTLGVAPRGFVMATGGNHTVADSTAANASGRMALGYGSWDGATIRQCCGAVSWIEGSIAGIIGARLSTTQIIATPSHASIDPGGQPHLEITAVDATDVQVTTRNGPGDIDFGYALLAGVECFAGVWSLPTGTGSKTFDMPAGPNDIRPKGALFTATRIQSTEFDATITNVRAGTIGWGAVDSVGHGGCGNIVMARITIPANTATYYDEHSLWRNHPHDQAGTSIDAEWTSWDSDGLTVNSLTNNANVIGIPMLLIGGLRVVPTGLDVGVDFGAPDLSLVLAPAGLDVDVAFGAPDPQLVLAPDGFDVPVAFGGPDLSLMLAPDGLDIPVDFGAPAFRMRLSPDGLALALALGSPSLSLVIAPDGLALVVAFGEPSIDVTYLLSPSGLALGLSFGAPSLALVVAPDGLAIGVAFGGPSFRLVLLPDGLALLVAFGSPDLDTGVGVVVPWPAGNVVQSGPVLGTVSQSGMVMGQTVQGGSVAGQVGQGGAVAGNVVQGGAVQGQVSQDA